MAAQQTSTTTQALSMDQDPLAKINSLLPILRESVTNVVQHAVYVLHNTSPDATRKNDLPAQIQSFIKIVEDFHNICDQIQLWLKLAISSADQTKMAEDFFPEMVGGICTPQDSNQAVISYSDYLVIAKEQVKYATKLQNLLAHHSEQMRQLFTNWKNPITL